MNKSVIIAMYNDIVSRDPLRPVLQGIRFEENRCIATDCKLLVVYKETNPKLAGKTMNIRGEEIPGQFPNVDRVFPSEESLATYQFRIDPAHLYRVTGWFIRLADANTNDAVVIDGKAFIIRDLHKLLRVYSYANEFPETVFYKTPDGRPLVIRSKSLHSLLMPCAMPDLSVVDEARREGESIKISYENLLNRFAFESWAVKPVAQPYAWLD